VGGSLGLLGIVALMAALIEIAGVKSRV
jgi:hypothetical protein